MSLDGGRAAETPALASESCEIVEWRGYVSRDFCARRLADEVVIARSPSFRCRGSGPAIETESARTAYDALAAELVATGWTASGRGEEWFSTQFERPSAPVSSPDRAPVEPTPFASKRRAEAPQESARPPEHRAVLPSALSVEEETESSLQRHVLAVCGIAVATTALAWLVFFAPHARHPSPKAAQDRQAHAALADRAPKGGTRAPNVLPRKDRRADVTLGGLRGGTWLEVRRQSSVGLLVYRGRLLSGQRLHLTGTRIWVLFGDGGNVAVIVNGRRATVLGATQVVVTREGLQRLSGVKGS